MADTDMQRSNGEPEVVRRRDRGGGTSPLPGSGEPANTVTGVARPADLWQPGQYRADVDPARATPADAAMAGTAPADAPAQPDDDPEGGSGQMPVPPSEVPKPVTGADAPSHGSR